MGVLARGDEPEVLVLVVGLAGEAEGREAAVQHHAAGLPADPGVGLGIPERKYFVLAFLNA